MCARARQPRSRRTRDPRRSRRLRSTEHDACGAVGENSRCQLKGARASRRGPPSRRRQCRSEHRTWFDAGIDDAEPFSPLRVTHRDRRDIAVLDARSDRSQIRPLSWLRKRPPLAVPQYTRVGSRGSTATQSGDRPPKCSSTVQVEARRAIHRAARVTTTILIMTQCARVCLFRPIPRCLLSDAFQA